MGLDLATYRQHVYDTLELDTDDLPTPLIDRWLAEGYAKIIRLVKNWSFYEDEETITTEADVTAYTMGTLRTVVGIEGPVKGQLQQIGHQQARDTFYKVQTDSPETGEPIQWSKWKEKIHLWPTPDTAYTLSAIGYKEPTSWPTTAGSEPDLPDDFHYALLSWAMYRARHHQDDPELAAGEQQSFDEMIDLLTTEAQQDSGAQLLIMGGGVRKRMAPPSRIPFPWE